MSRKLSYNDNELSQMTKAELEEQYEKNKKRLAIRTGVFVGFTGMSCLVLPVVAIVPVLTGALTGKWLVENNKAIKKELEKR